MQNKLSQTKAQPLSRVPRIWTLRIILLQALMALCFTIASHGQGYYYFEYQFYNGDGDYYGPKYEGLLVDFGSNAGIMRTRFTDEVSGKLFLIEQKVSSSQDQVKDDDGKISNVWVFGGTDAKQLIDNGPENEYYPDIIVLKQGSNGYYEPDYVYSEIKDSIYFGTILKYEPLKKETITNDFLGRFNWKLPDEKPVTSSIANATLHLILVSNTNDIDLSPAFQKNHKKIKFLFQEAAKSVGVKLNTIEILGDDFNKQTIENRLTRLAPNNNDIIFFYYSGHGFRYRDQDDQNSPWPQMALTYGLDGINAQNAYSLADMYNFLMTKGARLTMVIGECCNTQVDVSTPRMPDYPMMAPGNGTKFNKEIISKLLSAKGSVLLSTSKPEEFSMYHFNLGGYFCNSFYDVFLKDTGLIGDTNVDWNTIFNKAIKDTIDKAIADSDRKNNQNPQMYFNIKP